MSYKWKLEEDNLIIELAGNVDKIRNILTRRSELSVTKRYRYLKSKERKHAYTLAEDNIIKTYWPDWAKIMTLIPHKSKSSLSSRARVHLNLRINPDKKFKYYTEEELDKLRAGATELEGRTRWSVYSMRSRIGALIQPRWTSAERAALKISPFSPLPGRTRGALCYQRAYLGISQARSTQTIVDAGTSIMEAVQRAVPRTLPRHIQQEVLSDLTLAVLEGEIELSGIPGAVRKAISGVYKRYPVLGAPLSLDMPLFEDGGATLGDRIASDTFHF